MTYRIGQRARLRYTRHGETETWREGASVMVVGGRCEHTHGWDHDYVVQDAAGHRGYARHDQLEPIAPLKVAVKAVRLEPCKEQD